MKSLLPKFIVNNWRSLKSKLNVKLRFFKFLEKKGYHIMPVHYYNPIPDTGELLRTKKHWQKHTDLSVLNYDRDEELRLNKEFSSFQKEFEVLPSFADMQLRGFGPGYGEIEILILHSFVRYFKPKTIIEVGSGLSSFFSGNALSMNSKELINPRLICIEPYPYENLKSIPAISEIVEKKVQDVNLEFFQQLENNDILFLDSSHTVKIGSDVNYLILDVLPSLKKGVLIHIHDIFFPFLYPNPDSIIFESHRFWQETVLLKAFLTGNQNFEIVYCSSFLHNKDHKQLENTFPKYENSKHNPSAIWLRKII